MIRQTGVSEQTFYRREKQYVGLEVDQVAPVESVSGREQSVEAAVADLTLFQGMVAEYLLNQSAPPVYDLWVKR
jgi:hypothetical protein